MIKKIHIEQHGDDGYCMHFEGADAPDRVLKDGPFLVLWWPDKEIIIPEHMIVRVQIFYPTNEEV